MELAFGRLGSAARWHREARAQLAMSNEATVLRSLNLMWLIEALAKGGDADAACEAASELDRIRPSGFGYLDMGCALAKAWTYASRVRADCCMHGKTRISSCPSPQYAGGAGRSTSLARAGRSAP